MTGKKTLLYRLLIGVCGILLLCFLLYETIGSRSFMFFTTPISKVDTQENVLFLTFDDGPTDQTPKILDTLKKLNLKATFFLTGESIEKNPGYTKMILEDGHDIGNHSYMHQRMIFKPISFIAEEVEKTNALIREAGYENEIFFRPPYCKKLLLLPWYLSMTKQKCVTWTLEPEAFGGRILSAENIAKSVTAKMQKGDIILLHPMGDKNGEILKAIELITGLSREKGFEFMPLSDGIIAGR